MRVLVCGGRHYHDRTATFRALVALQPLVIICGACPAGADQHAIDYAVVHWTGLEQYPVDHALDGPWPAAGPKRNYRMLVTSKPDVVLAMPGGRGTANMIERARQAKFVQAPAIGPARMFYRPGWRADP